MDEWKIFNQIQLAMFGLAVFIFIALFRIKAGYGQHRTKKWGYSIDNRLGWVVMEIGTMLYLVWFYIGVGRDNLMPKVFMAIFLTHYLQRTFIFPLLIKGKDRMPLTIILLGATFNTINAYLQARWTAHFSWIHGSGYADSWLTSPQFIAGLIIFIFGFYTNLRSDAIIRGLRKPGDDEFHVPNGFMFKYVSCPSYLGEMLEWLGFAVLTFSLSGLVFFIWTFANLAPRAIANHKWYKKTFPEYPKERKALIPFIW